MPLPVRTLSCAAVLAALAGCGGQAPSPEPALPSAEPAPVQAPRSLPPAERLARVTRYLGDRYGAEARLDAAWRDRLGNRPVHRYVCLDTTTQWEGIEHSVLAVCSNRDDASDAEPGRLDAWLLRPDTNGGLTVAAQLLGHPSGLGGIASEPTLVQLGPDIPALALETPLEVAGLQRSDLQLMAAFGAGFIEVARFPAQLDNRLQVSCPGNAAPADDDAADPHAGDPAPEASTLADCDDRLLSLRTRWKADTHATGTWWPLQLEQTGLACGSAVAQHHRLDYDPVFRRYEPAPLLEACP